MSQLRQICVPHNPNAWRFPLMFNRGSKPNYSYNQYFIPSWPVNPPPHEWWHCVRPTVQQIGEHNFIPFGEMNHLDKPSTSQEALTYHTPTASKMNLMPTLAYYPYPVMAPVACPAYSMGFHTDAANYAELNVDRASDAPVINYQSTDYHAQSLNYLRRWEPVVMDPLSYDGQEFTIMSYNVLAQQLLELNSRLYVHCNQQILSWDYRKQRLLTELQNSDADILCLQEVQEDHYHEFFVPNMKQLGYDGIYKKRTGDKYDGCAIFYKESAFSLDTWQAIEFKKPHVTLLDRDNVAIVALFRPKNDLSGNQRVCVATTHLLFNPKRGDIKLAQLQLMFAEVDKIAQRRTDRCDDGNKHFPVIVCGDLNSEPHCQIYKFLHSGKIHYEGLPVATMSGQTRNMSYWNQRYLSFELLPPSLGVTDYCKYANDPTAESGCEASTVLTDREKNTYSSGFMAHQLNLVSVYDHISKRRPGQREITTQHSKASCTVDYIFYSIKKKNNNFSYGTINRQYVKENDLKLLATYSLLCDDEVVSFGGLPNCTSPSDHIPLMAKFVLTS
uniref:Endonuclease/exonuclease/phosphatase domain-containing protein n=1 Tax=Strigamia maritima TaxID=126957 RepID=T1J976_STRMM